MSIRLVASIVVWNDERFLRPVLDAAIAGCDEVLVTMAYEPWNPCRFTRDHTEAILDEYEQRLSDVLKNNWKNETDQRNAVVPYLLTQAAEHDDATYLVIIDADEIYDPDQLVKARAYLEQYRPTLAYVKQRVYFKHGNWLVEPDTHIAEAFVLMHKDFRFTNNRGNNSLVDKIINCIPEDVVVVHHFNTVGTYDEIREKHEAFSHAGLVKNDWLERWRTATLESTNLHQFDPRLLPALKRVSFDSLPPVCLPYREAFLLDEDAR